MSKLWKKFGKLFLHILLVYLSLDFNLLRAENESYYQATDNRQRHRMLKRSLLSNVPKDFTISYKEKMPKITMELKNIKVLKNEQAIFICACEGNPAPKIQWKVNTRNEYPKRYVVDDISPQKSVMRLNPVKTEDNNNRISCHASSVMGSSSSSATLSIYHRKEDTPPGFPIILSKSSVIVNEKNRRVLLECDVKGSPKPEITWLKDSVPVVIENPRLRFTNNGGLEINKTLEEDEGGYECIATNKHGTAVSNLIRLMIRENVEDTYQLIMKNVSYFAPHFLFVSGDQIVSPGSSLTLMCRALGNPIPEVFWQCGQIVLQSFFSNLTHQKAEARVILSDLSESINCTCVAKNTKERISRTISVIIQEPSIVPTYIKVSHVGVNSCNISWIQKSFRESEMKYQIFVIKTDDLFNKKNTKFSEKIKINRLDYDMVVNKTISNLSPFTNYTAWLESFPSASDSFKSNAVSFITRELPPYSPPQKVELFAISNGALIVDWDPPAKPNGIITSYDIYYTEYESKSLSLWEKYSVHHKYDGNTKRQTTMLSHLMNNKTYYISISARNGAGQGPVSEPQSILVRAGVVQGPKDFRAISKSPTEVQLFWEPLISKPQIGIKHYRLEYIPNSYKTKKVRIQIPYNQDRKTYLVSYLQPNTTYEFRLSVVTNSATGMTSIAKCTTSKQAFEEYLNITARVINSTTIVVYWKVEPKGPREIKAFKVQLSSENFQENNKMKTVKNRGEINQYTFTSLKPNTQYQIRISPVFLDGSGPASKSNFIKTWPKKLKKPEYLHLRLSCSMRMPCVKGEWKPGDKDRRDIRGYRIRFYPLLENGDSKLKVNERNVTETQFEASPLDLYKGYRYEFKVAAFNEFEVGEETIDEITIVEGTPPMPPSGLKLESNLSSNPTSLSLTWDKLPSSSGRVDSYQVICFIAHRENETASYLSTKMESIIINDLAEDSNYVCKVRVIIQKLKGKWSEPIHFKTKIARFPPPTDIRMIRLSHSTAQITWKWKPDYFAYYSHFIIYYRNENENKSKSWLKTRTYAAFTKAQMSHLNATVSYVIRISSVSKRQIEGQLSEIIKETSLHSSSWPAKFVDQLSCAEKSSTTIQIRWSAKFDKQNLTHFRVTFTGVTKFQLDKVLVSKMREEQEQSALISGENMNYIHEIQYLKPNTQYTIEIEPIFGPGSSMIGTSNHTICTTSKEPPSSMKEVSFSGINNSTYQIDILITRPSMENGSLDIYYIVVKISKNKRKKRYVSSKEFDIKDLIKNHSFNYEDKPEIYITLALKHDEIFPSSEPLKEIHKVTIGSDKVVGNIKNRKLNPKNSYQFQILACIQYTELQCTASRWSKPVNINTTISPAENKFNNEKNASHKQSSKGPSTFATTTVVVILGIVILVILSILLLFFIKRKKSLKSKLGNTYGSHSNRMNKEKSVCMEHLLKEPLVDSSFRISTSGSLRFKTPGNNFLDINKIQLSSTPDLLVRSSVPQPLNSLVQFHGQHFQNRCMEYAPIPVETLAEHVAFLKENDGKLFNKEYESIEPGQQFTWNCSNMEINRPKNRYANVIAYDHSRVMLQPLYEKKSLNSNEMVIIPGSDYINANYISGYLNSKAYIATQGPLAETIGDFWRMMWEQQSSVIVMMTRLEERDRTKCDQYWPLGGKGSNATYSYVNVTIVDITELAYYTIRKFHIQKINDDKVREVFQLQFTAWPDHGVPNHPAPLLMFLRRVHSEFPRNSEPIVVHCSAGVGRTGAFIVIDYMLERLRYDSTVDIYNYVTNIRAQRNYMVQTEDQYIFIYETLLEAVQCGNTEVPVSELANHIEKLNQIEISHKTSDGIQMTGLQMEFENLVRSSEGFLQGLKLNANNHSHCSTPSTTHGNMVTNYQPLTYETATQLVNQMKNRIIQILPPDFSRVNICPIRGVEGSDYINASWIDGYKSRKAYIAAQSPLPETCEDFWRTLWEHNSSIIVMLTLLKENNRERCYQYWPYKKPSRYQFFIVDPVAEYNMTTYVIREFKLTDTRDSQTRVIRQFQFTDWHESDSIPHSTQVFLDLINQVHKTKVQLGHDGPITVHCSTGSGRTGIFLALSNVIERMKNESVIDLFQTVKLLRWQRPALLQTEDQYQFCYTAALEYLKFYEQICFDL